MVAAYPTSDRQPLQRGCDVGRILRYCQTRNRSNTSRDTFRYAGYAFVFPITRQTRAGSQRTNSRPPVSSLLWGLFQSTKLSMVQAFRLFRAPAPSPAFLYPALRTDSRESYRLKITMAGGEIQAICPPDCITRFKLCVKRWNETAAPRPSRSSISTPGQPSPTAATMIDMRHGPLPTQDEAKWQLDFLARWKAKKYFIYSEGAIELDGYPVPNPEGRFSKEQIRRINTAILNQVGPNQDALRHLHQRPEGAAMRIRDKVIEQVAYS